MDIATALAGTAALVVIITAIVVGARQTVGLQMGLLRTVPAGFVALVVAGAVARGVGGVDNQPLLVGIIVGAAFLATMGFLLLAELLLPYGTTPIHWLRSLQRWFTRVRRYQQFGLILVRHGLRPYLRGSRRVNSRSQGQAQLARQLRVALEEAGVTFIKLGQVLSTRRDLIPPAFIGELSGLQNDVAPADWVDIHQMLVDELGMDPDQAFASFEQNPIAVASIAQVHRAVLRSGEPVVVKVQRPGIRSVVEGDLDIVRQLACRLQARTGWARSIGIQGLVDGFARAIMEELDFRVEADNMTAVRTAALTRSVPGPQVRIPAVYRPLSTERLLVMERFEGKQVESLPTAGGGAPDRSDRADALLASLLDQILIDGIFHCDPHPGNVMLLAGGDVGLLDFGVVGRIDGSLQAALVDVLVAVDRRDRAALCDALLQVVEAPDELDEQRLEQALGRFLASHLGPPSTPSTEMFTDLVKILGAHGLRVPPEAAAVFRALATLDGTLTMLAPHYDALGAARRILTAQQGERLNPHSLRQAATDEVLSILPILRRLPRRIDRISRSLEGGRFAVSVRPFADDRDRRYVTGLVRQIVLAFLAAATGLMAVLLLSDGGGPVIYADVTLHRLIGYHLLVVSTALILRTLVPPRRNPAG